MPQAGLGEAGLVPSAAASPVRRPTLRCLVLVYGRTIDYRLAFSLTLGVACMAGCATDLGPDGTSSSAPSVVADSVSSGSIATPLFTEVTSDLGVDFEHHVGSHQRYMMPAVMGGGAAVFDYDDDGDLDLYLVDSGQVPRPEAVGIATSNRLYRREAGGNFTDVTAASGLGEPGYGMGCAVGDIDNDGDLDLYVTNWGADVLYRNRGDGTFEDTTAEAGVGDRGWSTSATFFDYDRDGYLDLFVARYVKDDPSHICVDESGRREYCGPTAFPGVADLLYRNLGGSRFQEESTLAGLATVQDAGLGVVAADFDDDGWIDLYVANDADANNLWLNQGDGTFVDSAIVLGAAYNLHGLSEAGMGVTAGDGDGDGDLDLFVTHLIEETNTYYRNMGGAGFQDATAAVKLGLAGINYTGFGTAFFDYDNDGDLDLAVVNGGVKRRSSSLAGGEGFWGAYVEPNQLFANQGDGTFEDASAQAGSYATELELSRGFVPADFDGDGDLDVLVTNLGGPARLYRNQASGGHWLEIRPFLPNLRREAVGAKVTIFTEAGRYVRHSIPPGGYLTSGHARIHLGLGETDRILRFEVRWPSGDVETFTGGEADRVVELLKGSGVSTP